MTVCSACGRGPRPGVYNDPNLSYCPECGMPLAGRVLTPPQPISWCRIFRVGPVCAHLCGGCKRINNRARQREETVMQVGNRIVVRTPQDGWREGTVVADPLDRPMPDWAFVRVRVDDNPCEMWFGRKDCQVPLMSDRGGEPILPSRKDETDV